MKNHSYVKTTVLLLLASIFSVKLAMAQQFLELPLWPEKAGVEDYNDALIKVYIPQNGNGTAVIACPGGGYSGLALEKEGTNFASFFNEQGIALIVLKYRLPKGRPDVPLSDARRAIQIVNEHAKEWNVDKNKLGIMGSSAGGHLAATVCTHLTGEVRPAFQILLYPVISMKEGLTHAGSRKSLLGEKPSRRLVKEYSNELHVSAQTPPAFIVVSDDDKTVSPLNSVYYYETLHTNKVPAELHVYPKGGHGWALNNNFAYKKDWSEALKKWLQMQMTAGVAQQSKEDLLPVEKVKLIGDKLIRETPFAYRLVAPAPNHVFNGLNFVDFGRTFGKGNKAIAYAYTQLTVQKDTLFTMEIEHNDDCKVWCNGALVYEKKGDKDIGITRDERSMSMSSSFKMQLKKGSNNLLIKSGTSGKEWCVFIQPPGEKDAVVTGRPAYPAIGLKNTPHVDSSVAALSNWLVIGPFTSGINTEQAPEKELKFGAMYPGLFMPVTWTIPRVEVLGDMIGAKAWGTTYQWNYHNGGVAWAMEQLSELTGEKKYSQWAANFCDFQMEGMPFVNYQVNTLRAYNSANAMVINSRLLDFTLAPSLPLIYRLRKEKSFKNDSVYRYYVNKMMDYARDGQIRSNNLTNYTRTTPEEYTVWVDDMFMGIPFLMQAGLYTKDPQQQKMFMDDAASQVLDFTKHVWDKDARLFMHANYSQRPQVKLPYWSRANGWAIWAMSEVLMALPKDHPKYDTILQLYRDFANSLTRYQSAEGFWHNVINRNDSPVEVSGTAIFTMAMARGVRLGWLDIEKFLPVVEKGWKATASEIEDNGTVHKICVGTMCSEDVNYYMTRPFYDDDTHGSFAVIFAGMEVQKMLDQLKK